MPEATGSETSASSTPAIATSRARPEAMAAVPRVPDGEEDARRRVWGNHNREPRADAVRSLAEDSVSVTPSSNFWSTVKVALRVIETGNWPCFYVLYWFGSVLLKANNVSKSARAVDGEIIGGWCGW